MLGFLRSPLWRKRLILAALWQLTLAVLQVRYIPFPKLAARASRPMRHLALQDAESDLREAKRVAQIVGRMAGKLPFAAVCLPQALAAQEILRARGIVSTLHLGVKQVTGGDLPAHAWLSCGDVPLLRQEEIQTFTPLHAIRPLNSSLFADPCFKVLCEACQFDRSPDVSKPLPADWQRLLGLARRHRMGSLLHHHLKKYPVERVARQLITALETDTQKAVRQNMRALAVLARMVKAFEDEGIPFILLKGLSVGIRYYSDLSLRQSRDLDILIDPEHFEQAEAVLWKIGFTYHGVNTERPWQKKQLFEMGYHLEYQCAKTGQFVELHWRLSGNPHSYQVPFTELYPRTKTMHFGACAVQVMPEVEEFVFLCQHGSKHAWFRLKWLADIYAVLRQNRCSMDEMRKLAIQWKAGNGFDLALTMAAELFDQEVVSPATPRSSLLIRLAKPFVRACLAMTPEQTENMPLKYRVYDKLLYGLFFLSGVRSFLWYLYSNLCAPVDWQVLKLPEWARYLYLPMRPFLWAYRCLSRSAK